MQTLSRLDELAEIRAAMARLAAREALLCERMERQPGDPVIRPGWPIRRGVVVPGSHASA
jgi:hypothetical protein